MISAVIGAGLAGIAVAFAAAAVSRLGLRGDARLCLAAHLCAMVVRALGLVLIAVAVLLLVPGQLLPAAVSACAVVLIGLALDVRMQLRTLRAPTDAEEPARA